MNIRELQKNWDEFGKIDPLWAILTWPDKKGRKWQLEEFFLTGIKTIKFIMESIESLDINIRRRRALDFGCGVGRLTQALAHYFDEVYGVDIAPSMIKLAKNYNRYGDKCKYYLNEKDNLELFSDNYFDFIITLLTLQHMEPRYFKKYIKEFLRILAPNGLLIFQLPSEMPWQSSLKQKIKHLMPEFFLFLYRKYRGRLTQSFPIMEMYGMSPEYIFKFLNKNKAKIVTIININVIKALKRQEPKTQNFLYYVTK